MSDAQPPPQGDMIICHVTAWYYRRMGLMAALLLSVGLYFLYDGQWGYPSENKIAQEKRSFEVVQREYDDARAKGDDNLKAWMTAAKEKGWVRGLQSAPRWDAYAAEHNWPSNPELHSDSAIAQQFQFGYVLLIGMMICGALVLWNRSKKLTGHAGHMMMPDGKTVRYAEVFKVDKRKWDDKALAYIYYRAAPDGPVQRAIIDDLKFDGAGKVLDRVLSNFRGELIEKVSDAEEPPATQEQP